MKTHSWLLRRHHSVCLVSLGWLSFPSQRKKRKKATRNRCIFFIRELRGILQSLPDTTGILHNTSVMDLSVRPSATRAKVTLKERIKDRKPPPIKLITNIAKNDTLTTPDINKAIQVWFFSLWQGLVICVTMIFSFFVKFFFDDDSLRHRSRYIHSQKWFNKITDRQTHVWEIERNKNIAL